MREANINQQVKDTNQQFIQLFSSFDNLQVNKVPFLKSWTPAQVAQHVLKSETGILQALKAPGKKADREPDARVAEIKNIFLDFSSRLKSPDFIIPEEKEYNKEELIHQFSNTASQLAQIVDTVNGEEAIINPALGEMTKEEMIHFLVYHTQRHIHQLQHILQTLNDETKAMSATKEAIVRSANEAFNQNNTPAFLSYCTDDIHWNMIGNSSTQGKDAIMKMMTAMPSFYPNIIITDIFSGDNKTACTGTFEMPKKEDGIRRYHFCDIYHFRDEKIQALDSYVVEIKP